MASRPCATATACCGRSWPCAIALLRAARSVRASSPPATSSAGGAVLDQLQPDAPGGPDAVSGTDERRDRARRRRRAHGDDASGAGEGDRRLPRQGSRLHQVRRHEPFLGAGVHRVFGRGPAHDRRARTRAAQNGRDARHEPRRTAAGARSRHRRHPASRNDGWRGARRRPDQEDCGQRESDRVLDAREHHHRRGVGETCEGPRRRPEEAAGSGRENEAAADDLRGSAAGERTRAGTRGAAVERAETDQAGALVTVGTDSYWAAASELSRTPKPRNQDHGIGTIMASKGSWSWG